VVAIRAEVDKKPPNLKTLQPMLQGSVNIMVNKGPGEMVEEFLKENSKEYDPVEVQALAKAFMDFLDASLDALNLNKEITPPEMQAFHAELVQGYEDTCKQIAPYCQTHLPKEKKGKTKKKK
jgi:hypothetical protein